MTDANPVNRRVTNRKAADIALTCRIPAQPVSARLRDLTERGCRIELATAGPTVGSSVVIEPFNGDRIVGQVRWAESKTIGVRFDRRLRSNTATFLGLEKEPAVQLTVGSSGGDEPDGDKAHHWLRRFGKRPV
ncbi:PilZ domain-containing protein [Erythrobacter litoralis]|uniref:PilZ domain-containing protein n=1 Tax=Erythrobacter litoralis TaxID=39960 RepID=UPI002435E771|nr:PilZ domain-containing protein [Erythrobacter litoralis]MDG6078877.1 PilZ domain-containing protein [Erythrobacter litoralis]